MVQPEDYRVNLYPSSHKLLNIPCEDNSHQEKRRISIEDFGGLRQETRCKLQYLFVLEPPSTGKKVQFTRLSPAQAFFELANNDHWGLALLPHSEELFTTFKKLSENITVYRLRYPRINKSFTSIRKAMVHLSKLPLKEAPALLEYTT